MPRSDDARRRSAALAAVLVSGLAAGAAATGAADDETPIRETIQNAIDARGLEHFESKVRPLLVEHCLECHGEDPEVLKGGLDLSSAAGIARGGESGPVIVPGDPEASPLFESVTYANKEFAMPPRGRLSDQEIEAIRAWIEMGAPDPRTGPAVVADEPDARDPWLDPHGKGREHWAYRPMADVAAPTIADDAWSRTEIDRFILDRLREAGVAPVETADPRTLARRAFFDLVGLPPTPAEMDAFLADHAADPDGAWPRLVERLLA